MRTILTLIITFLLLVIPIYSQNYIWPTNASRYISSTFGEYREGHFHSGIDIKTNQKVGYPVYAVDNGYVWRIRTSPFGYGKAVYLKLNDGNIAVYGHLDRFDDKLLPYVRAEQFKQNRYSTDIYLSEYEIRVSRGDIVGYTGDTGSKHPHLHFELRDTSGKPFNPLNSNLGVKDNTIPTIKEIAIVPVEKESRVNGLVYIQIFKVKYFGNRKFGLDDTIHVSGSIGVEIKTHDTVRGLPNKYAPYGIQMYVDDSSRFVAQYNKFDFDETRFINIDRDFQLIQDKIGRFNRLWIYDTSKAIPFYDNSQTGILKLKEGHHDIKIEVYDHNRNTSTLKFTLFSGADNNPLIKKYECNINGYRVFVERDSIHSYRSFSAEWVNKYGNVIGSARLNKIETDYDSYILNFLPHRHKYEIIKITATTKQGGQVLPAYLKFSSPGLSEGMSVISSYIHNPQTFLCNITFNRAPEQPHFFLQSEESIKEIPLIIESPLKFVTKPVPLCWWEEAFAYEIRIPTEPVNIVRKKIDFKCITPDRANTIFSEDKVLTVTFGKNSVYDSLVTWVEKSSPIFVKGGKLVTDCYRIFPTTQPLNDYIKIMLKYPVNQERIEQIGLYRWDDEWEYVEGISNDLEEIITARSGNLGTFCLIRDFTPPVITRIFPGNGGSFRVSSIKGFKAEVEDELSGIKDDTSILVAIDSEPIIVEYHAVKNYIRYKLPGELTPGQHTLTITVIDRAMNSTTAVSQFFVLSDR